MRPGTARQPGASSIAAQLSREQQGITLRGSAEIVAEFFCKGLRAGWGRGETGAGGLGLGLGRARLSVCLSVCPPQAASAPWAC